MRFSSFIYLVGQGLHNLRANRLMTFASMGVLTVCMLLIGAASLLGINIDHMVEYIGNQNETVVYMGGTGESEVATDEQIAAADAAIRSTPHVVSVTYMSPEDVLATYSDMLKDYTNLQQVFANDNPFTPNYRVTVDDPDNIEERLGPAACRSTALTASRPRWLWRIPSRPCRRSSTTPATAWSRCWPSSPSSSSTTPSKSPSLTAARRSAL